MYLTYNIMTQYYSQNINILQDHITIIIYVLLTSNYINYYRKQSDSYGGDIDIEPLPQ
jgi:hypothetical protein